MFPARPFINILGFYQICNHRRRKRYRLRRKRILTNDKVSVFASSVRIVSAALVYRSESLLRKLSLRLPRILGVPTGGNSALATRTKAANYAALVLLARLVFLFCARQPDGNRIYARRKIKKRSPKLTFANSLLRKLTHEVAHCALFVLSQKSALANSCRRPSPPHGTCRAVQGLNQCAFCALPLAIWWCKILPYIPRMALVPNYLFLYFQKVIYIISMELISSEYGFAKFFVIVI